MANNGIPLCFRCFKGKHNPDAYSFDLIKNGISFCANLFANKNYHIIFLADRWFPYIDILSHIQSIGCFYCIRSKSFFTFSYYDSKGFFRTSHLRDIKPMAQHSKILNDVLFTRKLFKTNIVVSNSSTDDPWYLVTNLLLVLTTVKIKIIILNILRFAILIKRKTLLLLDFYLILTLGLLFSIDVIITILILLLSLILSSMIFNYLHNIEIVYYLFLNMQF